MKIKCDRTNEQTVTFIEGKNFSISYFEKPYFIKSNRKQLNIVLTGKNDYRIETDSAIMHFSFTDAFNVKSELAGLSHKLDTFNLQAESRLLDTLLEAAHKFNPDYEKRQLGELAKGGNFRNWREFYQSMGIIEWAQN